MATIVPNTTNILSEVVPEPIDEKRPLSASMSMMVPTMLAALVTTISRQGVMSLYSVKLKTSLLVTFVDFVLGLDSVVFFALG